MSIESAIIEHWGNSLTLESLIPSTSVSGGEPLSDEKENPEDDLPRARVIATTDEILSTNSTAVEVVSVQIESFATTNALINAIRAAIHTRDIFHMACWKTATENVQLSRVVGSEKEQLAGGNWKLTTDIELRFNSIEE